MLFCKEVKIFRKADLVAINIEGIEPDAPLGLLGIVELGGHAGGITVLEIGAHQEPAFRNRHHRRGPGKRGDGIEVGDQFRPGLGCLHCIRDDGSHNDQRNEAS